MGILTDGLGGSNTSILGGSSTSISGSSNTSILGGSSSYDSMFNFGKRKETIRKKKNKKTLGIFKKIFRARKRKKIILLESEIQKKINSVKKEINETRKERATIGEAQIHEAVRRKKDNS